MRFVMPRDVRTMVGWTLFTALFVWGACNDDGTDPYGPMGAFKDQSTPSSRAAEQASSSSAGSAPRDSSAPPSAAPLDGGIGAADAGR